MKPNLQSKDVTIVNYDLKTYVQMSPWTWKLTRWYWQWRGGVWCAFRNGQVIDGSPQGIEFLDQLILLQRTMDTLKKL